ncbi:MAG: GldG family protein [Candidatus Omnitrophica bacterium]|nr:GldG family protein [Candidatus Omnitrophota bacterium]
MKHFFIRTQIVFVSLILLLTFFMMMAMLMRFNYRWDLTREKIYSLAEPTQKLLGELKSGPLEILAFYPQDDPARKDFELFLKECAIHHPNFKYRFYDPDRVPSLARELKVKEAYTVILRFRGRQEMVVRPDEQNIATALLKLAHPKNIQICFATGHDEAGIAREDRNGLRFFRDTLERNNYTVHEIILSRDQVPAACQVVVLAGPHRELDQGETASLKKAFAEGKGILFMVDPMDPGTGLAFNNFMQEFGVVLGSDVIVDKMSRMVGGDFLVPLVNQYVTGHPITSDFNLPTFFPVARSVHPSTQLHPNLEVVPLAFTSTESWAETDLKTLEKGDASFEVGRDLPGPICVSVAAESRKPVSQDPQAPSLSINSQNIGGRLVVTGDSDFVTNAYLDLSGNELFAMKIIHWLSKDDRSVTLDVRVPEFKPLILKKPQLLAVVLVAVLGFPAFFFILGGTYLFLRHRRS